MRVELEPHITVEMSVDCRVQLSGLAQQKDVPVTALSSSSAHELGKVDPDRGFLQLREESPLLSMPEESRWLTVASVAPNTVERIRVVLPPGVYHLRCVSKRPVQLFAVAWDIERELN